MQQKKSLEFFSAKSFVMTQNKVPPGWSGWKDSFSSLKLRSKSKKSNFDRFWRFRPAVYSAVVTLELLRWCSWLIGVFWPLLCGWFDTKVPMGSWRDDTRTSVVIIAKYANTFYPSKKICSNLLSNPNSFIWLEGHLRPIYFEEVTKIEPVLIYSGQFWYILMALRWSRLVSRVFIEDMHFFDFPPHHCTINST